MNAAAPSACHRRLTVLLALSWALTGCFAGGGKPYQINFMVPPAFMEAAEVTPFTDSAKVDLPADPHILYVTLREPVDTAAIRTASR